MILAIDTSGPYVALASGAAQREPRGCMVPARLNHNEILDGELRRFVGDAQATADVVAVNVGPGSFTGTRVGVSYAIGLAQAAHAMVLPLSTYRIAAELASTGAGEVLVAFSVVRDQWCCCRLRLRDGHWQETEEREVSAMELDELASHTELVVPWGDPRKGRSPHSQWNPARVLFDIAASTPTDSLTDPQAIRVRYLGPSQAERNFHDRSG